LGAHDVSDRLLIPEKLYGREPEIETLIASFDRIVATSTVELVLVSGYSGIGKSSVVNELHKALVRRKAARGAYPREKTRRGHLRHRQSAQPRHRADHLTRRA
jgi:Cdc6-like AAA superfamily ATPase